MTRKMLLPSGLGMDSSRAPCVFDARPAENNTDTLSTHVLNGQTNPVQQGGDCKKKYSKLTIGDFLISCYFVLRLVVSRARINNAYQAASAKSGWRNYLLIRADDCYSIFLCELTFILKLSLTPASGKECVPAFRSQMKYPSGLYSGE